MWIDVPPTVFVCARGSDPVDSGDKAASADMLGIRVGLEIWAAVKATEIAVTLN